MWKTINKITNKKSKTTNITKIVVDDEIIEEPEVRISVMSVQSWLKNFQKVQKYRIHISNIKMDQHSNYRA